jgi:hypothetical protein
VPSDVDVVGYHPGKAQGERVIVVSSKAWQAGFDPSAKLAELRGESRTPSARPGDTSASCGFRSGARRFKPRSGGLTGQSTFDCRVDVTHLRGDSGAWQTDPTIAANLPGCSIGFLTLEEMWAQMLAELTMTPAASDIGRLAQLLKAAGLTSPSAVAPPAPPAGL